MPRALITQDEFRAERTADKLVRMLEMSLEDCFDILSIPVSQCVTNAVLLNAKVQTHRAVIHACVKLGVEAERARIGELERRWQAELDARLSGKAEGG